MPGIVSFILLISKFFIGLTGKSAEVSGRFIHLENNWIDLEYPCIGLGVFTLVAVLIFATKGNFKFKMIYLSGFAFVYLIFNALRLAVLLIYINNTYHEIGLNKLELHDNATYFMYVVAFAGFMGYWFGVGRKTIN
jgi:exosortase/archaeosortase family protein